MSSCRTLCLFNGVFSTSIVRYYIAGIVFRLCELSERGLRCFTAYTKLFCSFSSAFTQVIVFTKRVHFAPTEYPVEKQISRVLALLLLLQ
uniref:Secreted protein n=1 Tax=Trichuris muris TaxID=70415 RepID=A0A5S6QEV5_TRIMR